MNSAASWMLAQEAKALLGRLARIKPFALYEPMVPAAAISLPAQAAIESYLANGRRELREQVHTFLDWLHGSGGWRATPAEAQRRFTLLRLRFNAVLSQFDIFADVLTQRSEHETGIWLSGLDVVAADALALPDYYQAPPVICYLDRGAGAAIRRARTRLPGGGDNPVAIIRVPRERMVGIGVASSLVHEVGHQAVALLDLVKPLRLVLQGLEKGGHQKSGVWYFWERWISEVLADFWSIARVGVASTLGLIGVVSLPQAFVHRVGLDDPHPIPWLRVKLSCALGKALYPHPQWEELSKLWESFYPLVGLEEEKRWLLTLLDRSIPDFLEVLLNYRPQALGGAALPEIMEIGERQPRHLTKYYQAWRKSPAQMGKAPPSLVFAAVGQAKIEGKLGPEEESQILAKLLTQWALRSTLDSAASCAAALPRTRAVAPATYN
ncbi:hypothetical protein [Nitrosococcus watsonii]|uniref:Uncharacterized protein n=1 Tax=Nitrosococcus watsoni (strain C-113) TaxID=105559 RepID=D8K9K2_NITWC|nr:hypothetical protein [Nitrosococcus watsonii]ADJ27291.1 conserved hypothetical protein [Nitrosococcus watsonii C-113]